MAILNPIAASDLASSVDARKTFSHTGRSVIELIGKTPLLRLSRIGSGDFHNVEFCAKAEWFNP
ncbi:MAG: hypothetical protein WBE73_20755, partial [Candidatus Acidiferrum sp.]